MALHSLIRVLERDPDLGENLTPRDFRVASEQVIASEVRVPKGRWNVAPGDFDGAESLGLLLTDGIVIRKVTVGHRTSAELLGPGDVAQPWLRAGPDASVGTEVSWEIARTLRLAVLDRGFILRAANWPAISAAVARRLMLRVHWLAFHLAVSHIRRLDDRVLLVLWHFAYRWGRVTLRGVEIDLPLTHSLLAEVAGAHRPSVTVAVHSLTTAGHIEARTRSRWILHGEPPAELQQLHGLPSTASVPRSRHERLLTPTSKPAPLCRAQ
jgi:CRP/FNR family transcriptional regulator, cyclic AMP receptor protein